MEQKYESQSQETLETQETQEEMPQSQEAEEQDQNCQDQKEDLTSQFHSCQSEIYQDTPGDQTELNGDQQDPQTSETSKEPEISETSENLTSSTTLENLETLKDSTSSEADPVEKVEKKIPSGIYILFDHVGIVGIFGDPEEVIVAKHEVSPNVNLICFRFEYDASCFLADSCDELVWVIPYRNTSAIAFATNNRKKAEQVYFWLQKIGLTYSGHIDEWSYKISGLFDDAKIRLKIGNDPTRNVLSIIESDESIQKLNDFICGISFDRIAFIPSEKEYKKVLKEVESKIEKIEKKYTEIRSSQESSLTDEEIALIKDKMKEFGSAGDKNVEGLYKILNEISGMFDDGREENNEHETEVNLSDFVENQSRSENVEDLQAET